MTSHTQTPDESRQHRLREKARQVLLNNYHATGGEYITPAWPHYKNQWVWDSSFHAIACAELDMQELAKNEIRTLLSWQDSRGFIPHRIYHGRHNIFDLERPLYRTGGWHPRMSRLVGQPVIAQAVEAIDYPDFSRETIEQLVGFHKYFLNHRDAENVLSIISPRESGRDAAPEFDFFRPVAPKGLKFLGKVLDPLWVLWLDWKLMRAGWDEQTILERNIFHVKDVAEHCIFIDGLYSLQRLLEQTNREDLFPDIADVIRRCERALLEHTWHEADETFYPICFKDTPGGAPEPAHIRELSLGALFPLLVRDLPEHMRERIVAYIRDSRHFGTPYPVPSVPASHPQFRPSSAFPIWRGPVWMNANWFVLRGLLRHGHRELAGHIASTSMDMVGGEGFREFYNPFDGHGIRVEDFGWTTLVVTFPRMTGRTPNTHTGTSE